MNAAESGPELSIVIPVHNEEGLLAASVGEMVAGVEAEGIAFEVLLAENGSHDRTREIAHSLADEDSRVRTFSCPEPNYGGALREGIYRAQGELVVCEEIDLCDLDFLRRAVGLLRSDEADMVIGSKAMVGARDYRPLFRRAATRFYNALLRVVLGFRGTDTHGLKAFRRATVLPVVAQCIVEFDVFASELVVRTQRQGLRLREIPVELEEKRIPSKRLIRRVPRVCYNLARLVISVRFRRGAAVSAAKPRSEGVSTARRRDR